MSDNLGQTIKEGVKSVAEKAGLRSHDSHKGQAGEETTTTTEKGEGKGPLQTVKEKITHAGATVKAMADAAAPEMGALGGDIVSEMEAKCVGMAFRTGGPTAATSSTAVPGSHYPNLAYALNIGGHILASDVFLQEKQQAFNRAKTLERMVHPCGTGVFGEFEVTHDVSNLTMAKFLQPGTKTPVFTRFSTVTYGREYPDSARNPRGFAIKFYTEDGNYDMVGLNFPVFFCRNPMQGPDVIRSQTRNPENFLLNFDSLFDFLTCVPESLHCATMYFSDRGTPFGFRYMPGFGCHTFKWVNADRKEVFVKYHLIPTCGVKNFNSSEAKMMCGLDADFAKRDLHENIDKGNFPKWRFAIQVMTPEQAASVSFDPFDVTKVWPKSEFKLQEIGMLTLNRNPGNYHRDVEQAAFSPGSMVRGIEPSPDLLLQWRCFFYRDAQLHRLGVNLQQIPVNCPFRAKAYHPISRDGLARSDQNGGMEPHYTPNSVGGPVGDPKYDRCPVHVSGTIARKPLTQPDQEADFAPVRALYSRVMGPADRKALHDNIADLLKLTRADVAKRFLAMLYQIMPEYAKGVIDSLEEMKVTVSLEEIKKTAGEFKVDRSVDYLPSSTTSSSREVPTLMAAAHPHRGKGAAAAAAAPEVQATGASSSAAMSSSTSTSRSTSTAAHKAS